MNFPISGCKCGSDKTLIIAAMYGAPGMCEVLLEALQSCKYGISKSDFVGEEIAHTG